MVVTQPTPDVYSEPARQQIGNRSSVTELAVSSARPTLYGCGLGWVQLLRGVSRLRGQRRKVAAGGALAALCCACWHRRQQVKDTRPGGLPSPQHPHSRQRHGKTYRNTIPTCCLACSSARCSPCGRGAHVCSGRCATE